MNLLRITGAALLSACATALLAALFYYLFETDLVAFSWGYIPLGALIFGGLAAAGLFVACLLLNVRASPLLLFLALATGAGALALTYWLRFWLIRDQFEGDPTFVEYLTWVVTGQEMSVEVEHWSVELGPAGELGYAFAAFSFLAVLAGGRLAYRMLAERAWCDRCDRYLRSIGESKESYFINAGHYREHRRITAELASRPRDLAKHLAMTPLGRVDEDGVHYVVTSLLGCRGCGRQLLSEAAQVHEDGSWKHLFEGERKIDLPPGSDFSSAFSAPVAGPAQ